MYIESRGREVFFEDMLLEVGFGFLLVFRILLCELEKEFVLGDCSCKEYRLINISYFWVN